MLITHLLFVLQTAMTKELLHTRCVCLVTEIALLNLVFSPIDTLTLKSLWTLFSSTISEPTFTSQLDQIFWWSSFEVMFLTIFLELCGFYSMEKSSLNSQENLEKIEKTGNVTSSENVLGGMIFLLECIPKKRASMDHLLWLTCGRMIWFIFYCALSLWNCFLDSNQSPTQLLNIAFKNSRLMINVDSISDKWGTPNQCGHIIKFYLFSWYHVHTWLCPRSACSPMLTNSLYDFSYFSHSITVIRVLRGKLKYQYMSSSRSQKSRRQQ